MKVTEPTNLRLDADTKKQAYAIFDQVGLKPSQAFNLFLQQVVLNNGLPFEVKVPNATTREALDELQQGKAASFDNTEEFFDDLGI